jgi:hypothetical protein
MNTTGKHVSDSQRLASLKLVRRSYEAKLARVRAEILTIELGGPSAPVAADAWRRVADAESNLA